MGLEDIGLDCPPPRTPALGLRSLRVAFGLGLRLDGLFMGLPISMVGSRSPNSSGVKPQRDTGT
jgi:hypothetical protein